jgi:hypothetical protein
MGPAYHEEPGDLGGDSRVFALIYTSTDIKRVSKRAA